MRTRHVFATLLALILGIVVVGAAPGFSAEPALSPSETLGKHLFFDENLSLNKNQSCATCHAPETGWTSPDSEINAHGAVYEGSDETRFGDRKPPSSAYATQSPLFSMDKKGVFSGGNFWDGRATGHTLGSPTAEQAQGPYTNPVEQALPDTACVVYRACTSAYADSVTGVWGDDTCRIDWPTDADATCSDPAATRLELSPDDRARVDASYDDFALSIAAYEGSSESNRFDSKFDLSKRGAAKLTQQERRGFSLFTGKGQCSACHTSQGQKALFTDYTFDNLGVPKNPANPVYAYNPDFVDLGLGGHLAMRDDYARYADANMGKHKVPTLRNVGLGASDDFVKAYGHNGYFKSLYGVVHFYNTRDVLPTCQGDYTEAQALAAKCWPAPEVADNMNTDELGDLGLSYDDEMAIVAFLETLSDGYTG